MLGVFDTFCSRSFHPIRCDFVAAFSLWTMVAAAGCLKSADLLGASKSRLLETPNLTKTSRIALLNERRVHRIRSDFQSGLRHSDADSPHTWRSPSPEKIAKRGFMVRSEGGHFCCDVNGLPGWVKTLGAVRS